MSRWMGPSESCILTQISTSKIVKNYVRCVYTLYIMEEGNTISFIMYT